MADSGIKINWNGFKVALDKAAASIADTEGIKSGIILAIKKQKQCFYEKNGKDKNPSRNT